MQRCRNCKWISSYTDPTHSQIRKSCVLLPTSIPRSGSWCFLPLPGFLAFPYMLLASHPEILLGLHGLTPSKGVQAIWWMACPSNGRFLAWLPYGIAMEGFSFIQTMSRAVSYLLHSSFRQDHTINCEFTHTLLPYQHLYLTGWEERRVYEIDIQSSDRRRDTAL